MKIQSIVCFAFRLDPTAVFYRPNNGTNGEDVEITNPMEAEYADIEESIKVCISVKIDSHNNTNACTELHLNLHLMSKIIFQQKHILKTETVEFCLSFLRMHKTNT